MNAPRKHAPEALRFLGYVEGLADFAERDGDGLDRGYSGRAGARGDCAWSFRRRGSGGYRGSFEGQSHAAHDELTLFQGVAAVHRDLLSGDEST